MTTGPGRGGIDKRWIILAGAVVLALLIGGTVWGLSSLLPSGATPVATTTAAGTPSGTPTATDTPVVTPTPTPSATPTPTPTPTPTEKSLYCKAFARITAGGIDTKTKDGSIDFAELSDQFGQLITRYSAAAKVAPDSLKADYEEVLAYLRQGKKAVDAKSLDQLKIMVGNLGSLNDTMSNIQAESKTLCG